MDSNLLGIYIPTYNRADKLTECLESFIRQLKKYNFPIYISDNGSTDNTKEVIYNFKKRYNRIYYRRNRHDMGYAYNCKKVLLMGNTEFVWLFGDDDIIKRGAIDKIVKELFKYEFLQINWEIFDESLKKVVKNKVIKANKDIIYLPGLHEKVLSVLSNSGVDIGYMAQIITKRIFLLKELSKIDDLRNMAFLHSILFYRAIVGKWGKLISEPLIRYRRPPAQKISGGVKVWLIDYSIALSKLKGVYSIDCLIDAMEKQINKLLPDIKRVFHFKIKKNGKTVKFLSILLIILPDLSIPLYHIFKKLFYLKSPLKNDVKVSPL